MRFLDVRTDFAFKRVFGSEQSKALLLDFLNALIDFGGERITDLTIVDPYQIPLLKGMKDSYVDVKAVLSNQSKVIIEMQVLNVEGFEQRILYNAAKLYSTQLKQADRYSTLEPIIALTITDFVMFPDIPKVTSYWNLREREYLLKYSDDIELIFVELPKFSKQENELTSITDKWLYFIKHAGELNFIPQSFTEPQLREAFDIANTACLSEEELEVQFKRHDFIRLQRGMLEKLEKLTKVEEELAKTKEALAQGVAEGVAKEKRETARNMLRENLPVDTVSKCTGLSREEIEQLRNGG
ncbi:MAG: Rpn family recombination-promoting nuclease/putative transposase [Candidatus Electronema sp. V4]|uniref:Rpn family recombination-promoting nuclease/putative transposase n=1 Tax=Candidatus Electronema sp. V4 TaxID=3454756 RepID=UPI0040555D54